MGSSLLGYGSLVLVILFNVNILQPTVTDYKLITSIVNSLINKKAIVYLAAANDQEYLDILQSISVELKDVPRILGTLRDGCEILFKEREAIVSNPPYNIDGNELFITEQALKRYM